MSATRIAIVPRVPRLPRVLLALTLFAAASASAQGSPVSWGPQGTALVLNAGLGGLSSGILRMARGGSFWEGARLGAVGGAIAYGGKRIAASRWDGAGLVGRQVAAVGGSLVHRGGSMWAGPLLILPAGPLNLYVVREAGDVRTRMKVNLATVLLAIDAASQPGARWDAGASLSSGALVWRRPKWDDDVLGSEIGGVILLRNDWAQYPFFPAGLEDAVFAHERVHVLQDDFAFVAWSAPAEDWLWRRVPALRGAARYVDLGLNVPLAFALNTGIPHHRRPWEREATLLSKEP